MNDIKTWVHDIIDGVGGLHDYERYEMPVETMPHDEAVAVWVIRCLGNPNCAGADEVLQAIIDHRAKQDIMTIVRNIEQMRGMLDEKGGEG
jgi:hypothetical protein